VRLRCVLKLMVSAFLMYGFQSRATFDLLEVI
jgi:hypothetical protein